MKIDLSYGNGGAETSALIHNIFMKHFVNEFSRDMEDSAILDMPGKIAFTSDSFVVRPLFFPGGDIGRLAVCGTVNDLLTSGSIPQYISACFIIEEGMDTDTLEAIAKSMAQSAAEAGVQIVTGDTKTIEGAGGLYINTSGIGKVTTPVTFGHAKPGDALILTGNLGDHHACILSSRMEIESNIQSDAAPLTEIVQALINQKISLHGMRDVTRGGLATVLCEIAARAGARAIIEEASLPISPRTAGFASIMGLDILHMGNEGVMLIAVPNDQVSNALAIIQSCKYGKNAKQIGSFTAGEGAVLITKLKGQRLLRPLTGTGLPRIC